MKFCPECGAKLVDGAKFCSECGYKIPTIGGGIEETLKDTGPNQPEPPKKAPAPEADKSSEPDMSSLIDQMIAGMNAMVEAGKENAKKLEENARKREEEKYSVNIKYRSLDIRTDCASISISTTTLKDDKVYFECDGDEDDYEFYEKVKNGVKYITLSRGDADEDDEVNLFVRLPITAYDNISVETEQGDIYIDIDGIGVTNYELKSIGGYISVNAAGEFKGKDLPHAGSINIISFNNDITANISLNQNNRSSLYEEIDLYTDTGSIESDILEGDNISVSVSEGDGDIDLEQVVTTNLEISTNEGDANVYINAIDNLDVSFTSETGDLNIETEGVVLVRYNGEEDPDSGDTEEGYVLSLTASTDGDVNF